MLKHLLPIKLQKLSKDASHLSDHVETTISTALKSIKSIKNIYHDINELKESENPIMKEIYDALLDNAIELYRHVAEITDREYNEENLEDLSGVLHKVKTHHKVFLENLAKYVAEGKLQEVEIGSLINIDTYVYQSAKTIVAAVKHTYLSDADSKTFEKISEFKE